MLETRKTKIVSKGVMEERDKIISAVENHFLQNGFYKITMDEIASLLKMSKKTIYKHFSSKEELVEKVVMNFISTHSGNIAKIVSEEKPNAIEIFINMLGYIGKFLINVNEKWLTDLQSYQPKLWEQIDDFRTKLLTVHLEKIIYKGKSEGFFLDKPEKLIVAVFISGVRGVVNPHFIMNNNFSITEALNHTLDILMKGIMTPKGEKEYNKIKSRKQK